MKVESKVVNGITVRTYPHPLEFSVSSVDSSPSAEVAATIGASQSRDPRPLIKLIEDLTPEKKERIVGTCFKEYGHSSIGEMGNLFLTIEGISMLDALHAICFQKFSGQEASTRYIDFSAQQYMLPPELHTDKTANHIVAQWFEIYQEVLDILLKQFADSGMSKRKAKPKALDIASAFLPVATKTGVVLYGNIRNLIEHCWEMQSHSDAPITGSIGDHVLQVIEDNCPNSVKQRSPEELAARNELRNVAHRSIPWMVYPLLSRGSVVSFKYFDDGGFTSSVLNNALASRLPDESLGRYGVIRAQTIVSFRSLRDLLRHRPFAKAWHSIMESKGYQNIRFCPWYLEQLPEQCRSVVTERANHLISSALEEVSATSQDRMYLFPMGMQVFLEMTGSIDKWLYLLRLRSGLKVHPEVRQIMHRWIEKFAEYFDLPPDTFGNMTPDSDYLLRSGDA